MIIPQEKLLPQQTVQAWDSRNSFRNSRWVLLTRETPGRSCSAPSCGFHDSRLRLPSPTLGLRNSMWGAGTQPKPAKSQRVFLQLVSDGGPKGGSLQDVLVYKQNQKKAQHIIWKTQGTFSATPSFFPWQRSGSPSIVSLELNKTI